MRLLKAEGKQGVANSIKSMMKTLGLSLEATLSALKIPSDKRQTYVAPLNRQGTPKA